MGGGTGFSKIIKRGGLGNFLLKGGGTQKGGGCLKWGGLAIFKKWCLKKKQKKSSSMCEIFNKWSPESRNIHTIVIKIVKNSIKNKNEKQLFEIFSKS